MDPITGLQDPAAPDGGLQQTEAGDLPDQGVPTLSDAPHDTDAPDPEAMAALFQEEAQGDHDADDGGQDGPPAAGGNNRPDEGDWDTLSDDDKRRGFMRQGDYTRKTQALAHERRELEELRQKLLGIQQDLLTKQQAPPQATQQSPQPAPKLNFADCVDEDGLLDLGKLEDVVQKREEALEARIRSEYVNPLDQKLTAREQQEQQAELDREIGRLRKQHEQMQAAFPHYRDEAVQRRVAEYMQQNNVRDFHGAYAALYPRQYAEAYTQYQAAQVRRKQQNRQQPGPSLAPGRRMGESTQPPADEGARLQEMAKDLQAGGLSTFRSK